MAMDIRYRTRRAASLGQADQELEYGPEPLPIRDVPIDIRSRQIQQYGAGGGGAGVPGAGGENDLSDIAKDVHSIAGTLVLRRGLIGRVQTITSTPSLIINQQEKGGRGFLLLNPAGVVGLTSKGTLISSTVVAGLATLQSGSLGVANYKTAKLFFGITFNVGAGPVTIDIQTLDPVTGRLFISQTIGALVATGDVYADIGTLGVDTDFSVLVSVPAGTTITITAGFVLKDGLDGTSAGVTQTIFTGAAGVSTVAGYPLLSGKERSFYIMENVQIYAVTAGPSLSLNIFEL